jgi:hypothetical protein
MSTIIPDKNIRPTAGAIPIVVAVLNNPVIPGQSIDITVAIGGFAGALQVTLTALPDNLEGLGTFTQSQVVQQYNAIVRKASTESFIVTASTEKGSLSSESVVVLPASAVVGP